MGLLKNIINVNKIVRENEQLRTRQDIDSRFINELLNNLDKKEKQYEVYRNFFVAVLVKFVNTTPELVEHISTDDDTVRKLISMVEGFDYTKYGFNDDDNHNNLIVHLIKQVIKTEL